MKGGKKDGGSLKLKGLKVLNRKREGRKSKETASN